MIKLSIEKIILQVLQKMKKPNIMVVYKCPGLPAGSRLASMD
jgi:hypothetical protein